MRRSRSSTSLGEMGKWIVLDIVEWWEIWLGRDKVLGFRQAKGKGR
jgi:hypothetical protein